MRTLLIASGTYCDSALTAEFGMLPPCMLPLGNRRLYEWQIAEFASRYKSLLISLPQSYVLDAADNKKIRKLGAKIVRVPDSLSLGHSIASVLTLHSDLDELDILYGDTLVSGIPDGVVDYIATGVAEYGYEWHYPRGAANSGEVLCGFLSFSDPTELIRQISDAKGNFLSAVDGYSNVHEIRYERCPGWLDLGHIHTYFHSKAKRTTERAFNALEVDDGIVTKKSNHIKKLEAESAWFSCLPQELKVFIPAHYGELRKKSGAFEGYKIEYLPLPSLSDLFVFGRLPDTTWAGIFDQCGIFLGKAVDVELDARSDILLQSEQIFLDKSIQRIEEFERDRSIAGGQEWTINGRSVPSLLKIVEECYGVLKSADPVLAVIHGDLCFSNILYESRLKRIKLIDPRGIDNNGRKSIVGDQRYELAKLSHSVIGGYDFIVSGRVDATQSGNFGEELSIHVFDEKVSSIKKLFMETKFCGKTPEQWGVRASTVLLFLSMLPLHSDSKRRQTALLANALRLYLELN